MLATPGPLPVGPQWCYEVKWDGMRLLADISTKDTATVLKLTSRTGRDMTRHFPELSGLRGALADALLDGEVVMLANGLPSFSALAERFHRIPTAAEASARPVVLMLFDVLRLYGVSLLDRPLAARRATLERLNLAAVPNVRFSPCYDDGQALLEATRERGLEGVVAKHRESVYRPGQRSSDWVKLAHRRTRDCLVGGWRLERTHSSRIGGLLLGVPDADGGLRFAGRVGSGLASDSAQRVLREILPKYAVEVSPFTQPIPREDAVDARWCQPCLVALVTHLGWTDHGRLRQPVFQGLRLDAAL
ncbi:MAG: non-homologous end-joining DNA ligase [Pseudonocardia sp.]|nr:non-homologous end-joining DNA ligase [Pseudonocardia sp.]